MLDLPLEGTGLTDVPELIGNPWHGKLMMPATTYVPATLHLEGGGTRPWHRALSMTETVYLKAPDAPAAPAATPAEAGLGYLWRNYLLYGGAFPYSTTQDGIYFFQRGEFSPKTWLWQPTFGVTYRIQVLVAGIIWTRLGLIGVGLAPDIGWQDLIFPDGKCPALVDLTTDGGSALFYEYDHAAVRIDLAYNAGTVSATLTTVKSKADAWQYQSTNKAPQTYTWYTFSPYSETIGECYVPEDTYTVNTYPAWAAEVAVEAGTGWTSLARRLIRPYFSGAGIGEIWLETSEDVTFTTSESATASGYLHCVLVCMSGGGGVCTNEGVGGEWTHTVTYSRSVINTLYNSANVLLEMEITQTYEDIDTRPVVVKEYGEGEKYIDLGDLSTSHTEDFSDGYITPNATSLYVTQAVTPSGVYVWTKSPFTGALTAHGPYPLAAYDAMAYHPVTGDLIMDTTNLIAWV